MRQNDECTIGHCLWTTLGKNCQASIIHRWGDGDVDIFSVLSIRPGQMDSRFVFIAICCLNFLCFGNLSAGLKSTWKWSPKTQGTTAALERSGLPFPRLLPLLVQAPGPGRQPGSAIWHGLKRIPLLSGIRFDPIGLMNSLHRCHREAVWIWSRILKIVEVAECLRTFSNFSRMSHVIIIYNIT